MKILVIDDDSDLREAVMISLELQWPDAEVLAAEDGERGLDLFFGQEPNLVLLDVMMPGLSGFDVLQQIRRVSTIPVIFLTAQGDEADKVRGLELGADDYVTKPFGHLELFARMRALLRRSQLHLPFDGQGKVEIGDLVIDFSTRAISRGGQPVHLTPTEWNLLYQFVRNAGRTLSHRYLLTKVWGDAYGRETEHVKVYVNRLRQRLEGDPARPKLLMTERGTGYRFAKPVTAE